MILFNSQIMAQREYKPLTSSEDIYFSYKWKHTKFLKKSSPLMLSLKLKNINNFHAKVNFTVDYYWQGIRNASSAPNSICIKSNRTAKGGIKNLTFDRAKLSDEDIMSEDFILEISGISIEEAVRCRRRKAQ
jgi:hypothetical protein